MELFELAPAEDLLRSEGTASIALGLTTQHV